MRALTIHRPWAWAIAHGGKRIENRSWYPKFLAGSPDLDGFVPALPGTRIAIHAGASTVDVLEWRAGHTYLGEVLKASGGGTRRTDWPLDALRTGIVAVAELVGFAPWNHPMASGPWYIPGTSWAWVLGEVTPLETPISCKGRQRLWKLDEETRRRVEEQVGC